MINFTSEASGHQTFVAQCNRPLGRTFVEVILHELIVVLH